MRGGWSWPARLPDAVLTRPKLDGDLWNELPQVILGQEGKLMRNVQAWKLQAEPMGRIAVIGRHFIAQPGPIEGSSNLLRRFVVGHTYRVRPLYVMSISE